MRGILDHRGGEVGTRVEEVILNLSQHVEDPLSRVAQGNCHADGGVGFVAVRVSGKSGVVLRNPAEIAETGGSVVSRSGIDAGQMNCHSQTVPADAHGKLTQPMALFTLTRVSERFVVAGGNRLSGEVAVGGAKNSVLKLMAASLLAEGTSTITNSPDILDVPLMAEVLRGLGATVELDGGTVRITSPDEPKYDADFAAVRQFRASVCVLGPLVGRCKRAKVALPGGDAIGSRPLDMHQAGLRQLGARCNIEHGCVVAEAEHLRGAEIQLEFPSVGATENILMAAVVAEGVTTIHNAAREPDVVDLCTMLNQMGAQITGAGTPTMTITGVDRLYPTEHRVIGDRIVAATWGIAAAMTRGDISVTGVDPQHLQLVLHKLHDAGATVTQSDDGFRVVQYERPKAVNVATLPFPGFPTDLQPMAIGLASIADGTSMITENVFEARFRFVEEMIRLGADARTDGHHAVVRGIPQLSSAPVWSSDIRAGAGLVLAGLVADGATEVHDVFHIDRGYPLFVENLVALGAEIERVV
jgi:UDP-N-acetylglucosamine 1-carboxyvinyltransferase